MNIETQQSRNQFPFGRFVTGTFHLFLLTNLFGDVLPAAAQVPNTLLYSLYNPATNAEPGLQHGYSVAVDESFAVVGSASSSAKAYDATTGALLHTLGSASPAVGISGTLV